MAQKKPINTGKIAVGDCITYKKMCNLLGIDTYTGKQKQNQLEELQRYFDYNKEGTKYIITEIYKEPLPKEYKYPANAIYIQYIECILLQYLSLQKENNTYISAQRLWLQLGMINDKFIENDNNKNNDQLLELSPYMTNYDIYNFYKRCRSKLSDILNKSLESLSKRYLIKYNKTYMIIRRDENGIERCEEANVDELEEILKIERETLQEYELQNEQQIFLMNLTTRFYRSMNNKCNERHGWDKVFKCYHIIYNKKNVIEALPADKIALQKSTLNSKIIDSINTQAQNLYNRSITNKEIIEEDLMNKLLCEDMDNDKCNDEYNNNENDQEIIDEEKKRLKYYEYSENYVEMQELLSDKLLKI